MVLIKICIIVLNVLIKIIKSSLILIIINIHDKNIMTSCILHIGMEDNELYTKPKYFDESFDDDDSESSQDSSEEEKIDAGLEKKDKQKEILGKTQI